MPKAAHSVLVVDDDTEFTGLIRDVFRGSEYKILTANTPVDAIESMKRGNPEVILLDYQLPGINGDQLISALQEVNPSAKMIVISGLGGEEIEEKFRGSGYHAYFQKGHFSLLELKDTIQQAIPA